MTKHKKAAKQDVSYEGRDESYQDIDRIINEGLSGGSVHMREEHTNIEEARPLENEEPPHTVDK
ncbi:hypothetical protein ACFFIX_11685 [Metabacillus herbersteinensis]|uniref:DUF4025 domain-containing protein n=1 Tax=Metabacillus herbersteinensis TaxID=283816 RepID=A0ABV6GF73_9BACI